MVSLSRYICHMGKVFLVSAAQRLPAHSQVDRRGSECDKMGRQRGSSGDRRLRGETHSSSQPPGFPISAQAAGELGRAAVGQEESTMYVEEQGWLPGVAEHLHLHTKVHRFWNGEQLGKHLL